MLTVSFSVALTEQNLLPQSTFDNVGLPLITIILLTYSQKGFVFNKSGIV